MKRRLALLSIAFAIFCNTFSQEKFSPRILVLSPLKTSHTPDIDKEVDSTYRVFVKMLKESEKSPPKIKDDPESVGIMYRGMMKYAENINMYKMVSVESASGLLDRFLHQLDKMLVIIEDSVNKDGINGLRKLANSRNMDYVLSFEEVSFYRDNGKPRVKGSVQFYDRAANSLVMNKVHIGTAHPQDNIYCCERETLDCAINNFATHLVEDLGELMTATNATLKKHKQQQDRERTLQEQREELLINHYFKRSWDGTIAKQAIPETDSTINLHDMYYSLHNKKQDRFVAFFIRELSDGEMRARGLPTDTSAIYDKDTLYPGDPGASRAYMVAGLNYLSKWYYVVYSDQFLMGLTAEEGKPYFFKSLIDWDFFTDNDTTYNEKFWETGLFDTVPDLRKDPKWKEMKSSWEYDERRNRPYIGKYQIVAYFLETQRRNEKDAFEKHIRKEFYKPRIDSLGIDNFFPVTFGGLEEDELILVYPVKKDIVLCPVKIKGKDGKMRLHYYIFIPATNEIYEWTYFKPEIAGDRIQTMAATILERNLSTLTDWDFRDEFFDDDNFWKKYVLLKENGNYKYLRKIQ